MPFLKRRIPAVFASACVVAAMSTGMASARMPGAEVFKPTQGMIYTLGSKRAIGYFVNQDGVCQLTLMIAEAVDPDLAQPPSAARMTVSMMPGQSMALGSVEGESMVATCGAGGQTIEIKRKTSERS